MTESTTAQGSEASRSRRRPWRDPFWHTVVLATLLVCATAAILPWRFSGNRLWREQIEATQISWKAKFDGVVLGDSRASNGISTDTLERMLPGTRIGNLGMPGINFAGQYLSAAELALDPESDRRFVVMSMSPFVLHLRHARRGRFYELRNLKQGEIFERRVLRPAAWRFSPVAMQDLERWTRRYRQGRAPFPEARISFREEHGFVGRDEPYSPTLEQKTIDLYLRNRREPVDVVRKRKLVQWVEHWQQHDVQVFMVRIPTSLGMRNVEDEVGRVAEAFSEVEELTTAVGAVWLMPPDREWVSYDGSHLNMDSAYEFSEWLGGEIARFYGDF